MPTTTEIIAHSTRFIKRLARDQSGAAAIYAVISLPVLIGFVGLGVDVAMWQVAKRQTEQMADAAAVAGGVEIIRLRKAQLTIEVNPASLEAAIGNGYDPARGDTIAIYNPPISGDWIGVDEAVEVVITTPGPKLFSSLLNPDIGPITSRAVALGEVSNTCLWTLGPTGSGRITISGGTTVDMLCGAFANSVDVDAVVLNGADSCLSTTDDIRIVGGSDGACLDPEPKTGVPPKSDPLASLPPPPYSGCDYTSTTNITGGDATLSPGTYCADIRLNTSGTVTFNPGIYILDGAGLTIGAGTTVIGDGVMIFSTANAQVSDSLSVSSGANVTLSAPTSGMYEGILFYQERGSDPNITHNFTGGAFMDLTGIIYSPEQEVSFSGGASGDNSNTFIISESVSFTGNAYLGDLDNSGAVFNRLFVMSKLVE